MIQIPCCILAYNRPDVLEKILNSLSCQKDSPYELDIYLFIDGPRLNQDLDIENIDLCKTYFKSYFPLGSIISSDSNLGIARNWARAEAFIFEVLGAEFGLFLEDDLQLGPSYLKVLGKVGAEVGNHPLVAGWSAYSDRPNSVYSEIDHLITMRSIWGAILKKKFYLRRRNFTKSYLRLLENLDYRDRPRDTIDQFFRFLGMGLVFDDAPEAATSQDNMRRFFTTLSFGVLLSTSSNYATYIGKTGEHFNAETFDALGYNSMTEEDYASKKIEIPDDLNLLHDISSTVLSYMAYEKGYVPSWRNLVSNDEVSTLRLSNALNELINWSGQSKMEWGDYDFILPSSISIARAHILSPFFQAVIKNCKFVKINVGQGKENFMNAMLVPVCILDYPLDISINSSLNKNLIFVIEIENLYMFESTISKLSELVNRSSKNNNGITLWIKFPKPFDIYQKYLITLKYFVHIHNGELSTASNIQELNEILGDTNSYLFSTEFTNNHIDSIYAIINL